MHCRIMTEADIDLVTPFYIDYYNAQGDAWTPELVRRHIDYNRCLDRIAEREERGELLVIRPEAPLDIGRTEKDPARLRAVYEQGRQAAQKRLSDIQRFLNMD